MCFFTCHYSTPSRAGAGEVARDIHRLAGAVSATYKETFETIAQFADLHADIIDTFGRFPHRNAILNRQNSPEEDEYLSGDAPTFGQGES